MFLLLGSVLMEGLFVLSACVIVCYLGGYFAVGVLLWVLLYFELWVGPQVCFVV